MKHERILYFDIETGPQQDLMGRIPPFDPSSVKLGNTKDEQKIADKIREAEASHVQDFIDRAALDPLYGRVLCVAVWPAKEAGPHLITGDERDILESFWALWHDTTRHYKMCCYNAEFDVYFLRNRSWVHGIRVPSDTLGGFRYNKRILDPMGEWSNWDRQRYPKLDVLCRALLGEGKMADLGEEFHKHWFGTLEQRELAEKYALHDVRLLKRLVEKMHLDGREV